MRRRRLGGAFGLSAVSVTTDYSGPVLRASLVSADVHAAAAEYLATAPHGSIADLVLIGAASVDGRSATVSPSAYWRPPVLAVLLPEGMSLSVTAVARSVFRELPFERVTVRRVTRHPRSGVNHRIVRNRVIR